MANQKPHYQVINGLRFPPMFSPTLLKEAMSYKPNTDEVCVVSYPRSGSNWMQSIVLFIFRKGQELEDPRDFFKMSPFIDALGNQGLQGMPRPGAFKTNLPFTHMPYPSDAKYIYIIRNPKDCCVSLYHYTKKIAAYRYWEEEFGDFFELFLNGEVIYNDYFDHLDSWYAHRNDKQVFFTTYEQLKEDRKSVIQKVAAFLGKEYVEAIEKDNSIFNNILHFSDFDYMKKNITHLSDPNLVADHELDDPSTFEGIRHMRKYAKSLNLPNLGKLQYVRKGVTGDWKIEFSEEQSERFNKKFFERTKGTEIETIYRNRI